jgi:hypothetical protein
MAKLDAQTRARRDEKMAWSFFCADDTRWFVKKKSLFLVALVATVPPFFGCASSASPTDASCGSDCPALPIPGDTCQTAGDISAGGTFHGTTCGAHDDVQLSCGGAGTPDVFYALNVHAGEVVTVAIDPPQFNMSIQMPCGTADTFCAVPNHFSAGYNVQAALGVVIESTQAGGCGEFTLTVTAH